MSILTAQERERLVLELYNQSKTIREIAKEVQMSFTNTIVIVNKAARGQEQEREVSVSASLSMKTASTF
jgi:DNA-directed RNA polymerase specialized sigma subunit